MEDSIEQPVVNVSLMVKPRWHLCTEDFQGYDENGLCRSLQRPKGRLTGAHKVLCSAGQIACRGRKDGGGQLIYLGEIRRWFPTVIPVHSKIGHALRMHFERLVNWYERRQLVPVYIEDNIFNFYVSKEVKSTEANIVNNSQQPGNECGRAVRS